MSRLDDKAVAGFDLLLRAVPTDDFHAPLNDVSDMVDLAAIGLRDRLNVLGPLPARLMVRTADGHAADVHDLQLALAEWARFVGRVKALLVNRSLLLGSGCICHRDLLAKLLVGDRPVAISSMRLMVLALAPAPHGVIAAVDVRDLAGGRQ